jgi:membrane fusion protein (multidrug efflux system)
MMKPHKLLKTCGAAILITAASGCGEAQQVADTNKKGPPAHLVQVAEVVRKPVNTAHERTGTLRARRLVRIHSQEEGRITALPFFEGDRVKKDDLLVSLDDELLKAELAKAEATTSQARQDLSRISNLAKKRAASRDELSRVKTKLDVALAEQNLLQVRLSHTRISAPFDGVISVRHKEPGDLVAKHTHLLTLTDPGSLVTEIHVSELLLPHLKLDDPARVRIDAIGNRILEGRILRIHPELDPVTRQGIVEVILQPVPEGARAGQFARVTLETARVERLVVPFLAIRHDKDGEHVFLLNADNVVRRVQVRSGIRLAEEIEVLEGLEPGQRVVTRGFLGLAEGKRVKPVSSE